MQQFNAMLVATAFYDFEVNKNSDNHCCGHADQTLQENKI